MRLSRREGGPEEEGRWIRQAGGEEEEGEERKKKETSRVREEKVWALSAASLEVERCREEADEEEASRSGRAREAVLRRHRRLKASFGGSCINARTSESDIDVRKRSVSTGSRARNAGLWLFICQRQCRPSAVQSEQDADRREPTGKTGS